MNNGKSTAPLPGQTCLAILGPSDQPDARVIVIVLGGDDRLPDFYRTVTENGQPLLVHRHKLQPIAP